MTNPTPVSRWSIQGSIVGGIIGAVPYFLSCRWVQGVLSDENLKHNLTHPNPNADMLFGYAVGVGLVGLVIGGAAGVRANPAKAAGIGAALSAILPSLGMIVLIGSGTPHPWVVRPITIFLGSLILFGTLAGFFGGFVGQRLSDAKRISGQEMENEEQRCGEGSDATGDRRIG